MKTEIYFQYLPEKVFVRYASDVVGIDREFLNLLRRETDLQMRMMVYVKGIFLKYTDDLRGIAVTLDDRVQYVEVISMAEDLGFEYIETITVVD